MTLARAALRLLDRSVGRKILASYASWHARRASGREVEVLYDGVWMHRVNGIYWADAPNFAYHRLITPKWMRYADGQEQWGRDFWFHVYEPQQGDIIVDIGAGAGTDLPLFSRQVGPDGRVIAIEAHPTTFEMMERTVDRNQLANVRCFHKAIVDRPGTLAITDDERHISNAIDFAGQASSSSTFNVEGCTLETVCAEAAVDRIDLLKMNIEGAEQYAILGMSEMLERIRNVCICCHDFRAERGDGAHFRTRKVVTEYLCDHGFKVTTRDDDARPFVRDHIHGVNLRWSPQ